MIRISSIAAFTAMVGLFCAEPAISAEEFEKPRSSNPTTIPGIPARGADFTLANPVVSDGFMRIYTVKTRYGDFSVIGDGLLRVRLREVAALAEIERVTTTETFNRALAEAGLSPLTFAGNLITNPLGTLGNTMSGIGSLFGQLGSSAHNAGKTQSDPMADITGVSRKKRELAIKLGVDPYTDFEPLQQKMTQLAQASASGGLVISGALLAIPGVGGIIVSNAATSHRLTAVAVDLTPPQLLDRNRQKLLAMGVDAQLAERLITNRAYSPLQVTGVVDALEATPIEGRDVLVARAASVGRRDAAFFMLRQAELLEDYQRSTGAVVRLVPLGGFPFARTADGVLGLLPLDALSWTQNSARAMRNITDSLKRSGIGGRAVMRITGQATPLAKKKMKALGWTLVENTKI